MDLYISAPVVRQPPSEVEADLWRVWDLVMGVFQVRGCSYMDLRARACDGKHRHTTYTHA